MKRKQAVLNLLLAAVMTVSLVSPFMVQEVSAEGWLSGWDQRIEITVDNTNIDSDLTHFPIPVFVNDSAGQDDDDLSVIFDEVGANWEKIAVTEDDGTSEIYVEKELWDDTAEEGVLWVSKSDLTLSSSTTTTLYIYYDNDHADNTTYVAAAGSRTEVWKSVYKGVWHLSEDAANTTVLDSTSNNSDGVMHGGNTEDMTVAGAIGPGFEFDGSGTDWIDFNSPTALEQESNFSMMIFFNTDTTGSYGELLSKWKTSNDHGYGMKLAGDDVRFFFRNYNSYGGGKDYNMTTTGEWHLPIVYYPGNGSAFSYWLDGNSETFADWYDNGDDGLNDQNQDLYIGRGTMGNGDASFDYFDGVLDEGRVYTGNLGSDWYKAEWEAFNDNLLTFGDEELIDTTNPTLLSTTPSDDAVDISITANLVLTFDEVVNADSGNIVIKETSDDTTFETIGVTSGNVTGTGTTTITVDPTSDLDNKTEYYVQVDDTAFDDAFGNSYAGIADTTSWSFETGLSFDWGTPSVTTSDAIIRALDDALEVYRPDDEYEYQANIWVVTGHADTDHPDYQFVSVVGMIVDDPTEADSWTLESGVWMGLAIVEDEGDGTYTAAFEGSTGYNNRLDDADLSDPSYNAGGGSGSYRYYFPWVSGTLARYGYKAVHDDVGPPGTGYGARGWLAVDFVGGTVGYPDNIFPNGAYVVEAGEVSFKCQDEVQTFVQIGNFLYGHLVYNSNLDEGSYHNQGDYLGALVTGTHRMTDPGVWCGEMDQMPTSYHLHLGFKPSGNYFQMEDWVLNLETQKWVKGSEEVAPLEHLMAEWGKYGDVPPIPTPGGPTPTPGGPTPTPIPYVVEGGSAGGGASFWNGFISMAESIVRNRTSDMESHAHRDVSNLTVSGVRIAVSTVYVLLRSNLNLTITMIVFGALFILEPVRILRSIWMGIKEMIPFIG